MTDLQSRAKTWLQSLITEAQTRELPDAAMEETIYSLETVGMEAINREENPLEELMEEFPEPKQMANEDILQELHSAWVQLSPTAPD